MTDKSDSLELQDEVATYDTRNMTYAELVRTIPRRLCKYQSIKPNALDGLRNHALWFSSPDRFNDPFDCDVSCFIGRNRRDFEDRLEAFFRHSQENAISRKLSKSAKGWKKKERGFDEHFPTLLPLKDPHLQSVGKLRQCADVGALCKSAHGDVSRVQFAQGRAYKGQRAACPIL